MMTNQLYLRKYEVVVSDQATKASSNGLDVSDLRCSFVIEKKALQKANYGDITIWNLSGPTRTAIIKEGRRVIISAGYQDGQYGKIFDGTVFQPLFDRENVLDEKLTLHCLDGDSFLHNNFVNVAIKSGYNYPQIIATMANNARVKIPIGVISPNLNQKQAPRGKVVFGDPRETFRQIARDNNAQFFVESGQLHFVKLTDVPKGKALVISPSTGLVGTPQQIDYGFTFRCLLNPSIRLTNPYMMVKLDNSIIRQQKVLVGEIPTPLDQDMQGIVIGVNYTGDTRGPDWYCDVTCCNSYGQIPAMLANGAVNPN